MSNYLTSKLIFSPDAILDPGGYNVMMEWEKDIMESCFYYMSKWR